MAGSNPGKQDWEDQLSYVSDPLVLVHQGQSL